MTKNAVLPVPEQTDVRSVGEEVVRMEQEELSADFKQKVAEWEAAGVFGRIAAKVDEVLEQQAAAADAGANGAQRRK